jgi:hypothetical protein
MSLDDQWNIKFEALLRYCREKGTANVPQKYKCNLHDGSLINLGKWVYTQRLEKKKGVLRQDKVDKFQSLVNEGVFDWEPSLEEAKKWDKKFEAVVQFALQHGHCHLPRGIELPLSDGSKCNLYNWLTHELVLRRQRKMKPEREQIFMSQLIAPGYLQWDKKQAADEATWDLKFKCLVAYANAHNGNYNVPESYKYVDPLGHEIKLGIWLSYQRVEKRKGKLRKDREEKMNRLVEHGFLWDPNAKSGQGMNNWDRKFEAMLAYEKEFGTCNVPDSYKSYQIDGKPVKLGRWLSKQRSAKKYGKLNESRLARLQALVDEKRLLWEFSSSEFNAQSWEEKYNLLVAYGNIHGSCELPRNAIVVSSNDQGKSKEYRLGEWLYYQKSAKKYLKLKPNREEKLDLLVKEGKLSWEMDLSSAITAHPSFNQAADDSAYSRADYRPNESYDTMQHQTVDSYFLAPSSSSSSDPHGQGQRLFSQPTHNDQLLAYPHPQHMQPSPQQQQQAYDIAMSAQPYISLTSYRLSEQSTMEYGSDHHYQDEDDDSSSSSDDDDDQLAEMIHFDNRQPLHALMNDNSHQTFALSMEAPPHALPMHSEREDSSSMHVPIHVVYGASGNRDTQLILPNDKQYQPAEVFIASHPTMFPMSSYPMSSKDKDEGISVERYLQPATSGLPEDDTKDYDDDDEVIVFATSSEHASSRRTKRPRLKS